MGNEELKNKMLLACGIDPEVAKKEVEEAIKGRTGWEDCLEDPRLPIELEREVNVNTRRRIVYQLLDGDISLTEAIDEVNKECYRLAELFGPEHVLYRWGVPKKYLPHLRLEEVDHSHEVLLMMLYEGMNEAEMYLYGWDTPFAAANILQHDAFGYGLYECWCTFLNNRMKKGEDETR